MDIITDDQLMALHRALVLLELTALAETDIQRETAMHLAMELIAGVLGVD